MITGKENLKNSQCFRFAILIRDRGEKINSLMSKSHLSDNSPARRDDGMGDRLRKGERKKEKKTEIIFSLAWKKSDASSPPLWKLLIVCTEGR